MRKEGVDAGDSLLRILGVDLVFDLAETNGKIVADMKDSQR